MSHLRYDIRAKSAPTGSILASFDESEVLEGTKVRFQLFGSGSILIVVHDNQPNVTPTVFAKGNHLTVVDLDLGAGESIAGGWLDTGDFEAVSTKERSGRILSFGGPGDIAYVRDAVMDTAPYVGGGGEYNGPRDDMLWHWGMHSDLVTFDKIGAILKRILDEALDPDRPRDPISALTYNFTNDIDSASAAWDSLTGGFTLAVGRNYLDCIQDFIRLGLTILMKPTLQLNAFQGVYGTDRSSATFAASKVRFEEGINVAGTLKRPIHEAIQLKQVLVAGDGAIPSTVVRVTDAAATIEREGFLRYSPLAADAAASLTDAGERDLAARKARTDTAVFPIAHGDDQLNGRYIPGWPGGAGHFWVGDTVRLHTGSGVQDFNETNIRVAAISWVKREGGGQDIVLELGASYAGGGGGGGGGAGGGCTCPQPPSQDYTFGTPATDDIRWDYNTNNKDNTNTYPTTGEYSPDGYMYANVDAFGPGTFSASPTHPIGPGTFHFGGNFGNRNLTQNPFGVKVQVYYDAGAGFILVHTSPFLAPYIGYEHYEVDVVFPSGTTQWVWRIDRGLSMADNVFLSHGGAEDSFPGDTPPPGASDPSGSIGTDVGCYALCDHRHPAQPANVTPTADQGGFFTGGFVEEALQELAARAWKQPVRVATTATGTLASSFENGDTIDGVVLATGDRILIKDQAAGAENGIYTVNVSGAPTRAADFDLGTEALGAAVIAMQGTANADKVFICTTNGPITLGTTALVFAALSAAAALIVQENDVDVDTAVGTLDFGTALNVTSSPAGEANVSVDLGSGASQAAPGDHTHTAGDVSKASATADLTATTTTAADVTGASLSLAAGTYVVIGNFDVSIKSNADRLFEGVLDVGGVDENDLAVLQGVGLDTDDRGQVVQIWRVVLGSTTTVKLQARHSGGAAGDFTVNAANTTLTAYRTGGVFGSGTSFPASPSSNDLFYRTDRDLLYFYDGTRWLSVNLYEMAGDAVANVSVTFDIGRWPAKTAVDGGIWVETFYLSVFVSGTNNGSNYWTLTAQRVNSANSPTTLGSAVNTSADAGSTWLEKSIAVAAVLDSTARQVQIQASKTAAPANLYSACQYTYRKIG